MSKLILGGEEFYKMKWDELLENDWEWSGSRSFKLGIKEDFSWDLSGKGLSMSRSEEKAFWVQEMQVQRLWGRQA